MSQFIHSSRVISAFQNEMDQSSLDYYRGKGCMALYTMSDPIKGFPDTIDDSDIGNFFINGEEITDHETGFVVWRVTDGHHRSTVASEQGVNVYVELDQSCKV